MNSVRADNISVYIFTINANVADDFLNELTGGQLLTLASDSAY